MVKQDSNKMLFELIGLYHIVNELKIKIVDVLIDFSLTIKAAIFIFISGRGSTIPSAKEGK